MREGERHPFLFKRHAKRPQSLNPREPGGGARPGRARVVLMPGMVVVGAQWGDEGKGKVTDVLAERADMVVRFQGGNNAGHTVVVGEESFKFHLLPSGVVQGKEVRIAQGVVLDPRVLVKELDELKERGISAKLRIDPRTHIILPCHTALDEAREGPSGQGNGERKGAIGTTRRGIGPCYEDRAARAGIRFEDLISPKRLRERLMPLLKEKALILERVYDKKLPAGEKAILDEYAALGRRLSPYAGDVSSEVHAALASGKRILFESAQGTLLDLSFGTYPYVTSSHPIAGSVFVNVGLPPAALEVVGVTKAYTTRIGMGPFPTELTDNTGERLREQGHEFGTTTGRPRRCGWLDIPMLRYSHRLNGFSSLALTKLDVLSGMKSIKAAVSYRHKGKLLREFPSDLEMLADCEPMYRTFKGFTLDAGVKSLSKLPREARDYIAFIEKEVGVPVTFISIGPRREDTLFVAPGKEYLKGRSPVMAR